MLGALALVCAATGITVLVVGMRGGAHRAIAQRTLSSGILAEGQVLHTYLLPGDQGREGVRCAVLAFRTVEGREFLINDESGLPRVTGDRVAVRYLPEHPAYAVLEDVPRGVVGPVLLGIVGAGFMVACLLTTLFALTRSP